MDMNDENMEHDVTPMGESSGSDLSSTPATEGQEPAVKPKRTRKAASPKSSKAPDEGAAAEAQAVPAQGGDLAEAGEAAVAKKPRARRPKLASVKGFASEALSIEGNASTSAAPQLAAPATVQAAVQEVSEPVASDLSEDAHREDDQREGGADLSEEVGEDDRQRQRQGRGDRRALPPPEAKAAEMFAEVLSEGFDESYAIPEAVVALDAEGEAAEHKRVLLPEPEAPKLHKVLAQSGIGSRREMERMIEEGEVEVNDQVAHTGQRISFGDQVKVRGKVVRVRIMPPPPRIIAYHKQAGEIVSLDDPEGRPTVFRHLPRLQQGKWQSVGRLDLNTEGLLLFTNNGELANQLMHPRFGVEREYAVRVLGTLEPSQKERLLQGVEIEGQPAAFRSIENGGGEGVNRWYRVVITEGRNREVRKLFDAVGLTVSRLIRIRYGCVVLPKGLKRGVWVDLADSDVRAIRQLVGHGGESRDAGERGRGSNPRGKGPQRGERSDRGPDARHERGGDRGGDRGADRGPDARGDRGGERRAEQGQDRGRSGYPDRDPRRQNRAGAPGDDRGDRGPNRDRRPRPDRNDRPDNRVGADTAPPKRWNDDEDRDFDPSRIPNPLEQTFDKRFVAKPRMAMGGKGFKQGYGGFGTGGSAQQDEPAGRRSGGAREPDPLQTSVAYLGGNAYLGGGGGHSGNRKKRRR